MSLRLAAQQAIAFGLCVAPGVAAAAPAAPPAEDFGARPRIANVTVSPGGTRIAALISPDGAPPRIAVWETADMTKPPKIIPAAADLEFKSVRFLKDDRLWVTVSQRFEADGGRTYAYRSLLTDPAGSFFTTLAITKPGESKDKAGVSYEVRGSNRGFGGMNLISSLPSDPDYVLASDAATGSVYRVNVHSSASNLTYERLYNGSDEYSTAAWNWDMTDVRARVYGDFIDGKPTQVVQIKNPTTGQWEDHFKNTVADRQVLDVVDVTADPDVVLIAATRGGGHAAIYPYSVKARTFGEPLFAHNAFGATGVIRSRDPKEKGTADEGRVLGYTYGGVTGGEVYWIDERMSQTAAALRNALGAKETPLMWVDPDTNKTVKMTVPENYAVSINSMSNDRRVMIVERAGPRAPEEYYVYIDGKGLNLLARSRPQMSVAALGDTRLVEYPARDGLMIPAFLTTPDPKIWGKGPFPAIVVPHGGPWSRDYWSWDPSGWTQYFAARGYAVIQPQFRGSEGWGMKLWKAGDGEWGQKMSDDNDDAARWMIAQGIARKGQVALHGYSYGGFAAFAAGVRGSTGEFRCAIAGAGVAELPRWRNLVSDSPFGRAFQGETLRGMDPWQRAAETSIPMMIYHGDRDQRVPIREGMGMYEKLRAAGKPVTFLELKDMGHQYDKWSADNVKQVLTGVETFLANDCGLPPPGRATAPSSSQ
ncbi:alpha/beta hydrolase family protein [Caulobacter mirabilis]|nr:alpha/beta fold hydrolase [Caulobacter mirabilis]